MLYGKGDWCPLVVACPYSYCFKVISWFFSAILSYCFGAVSVCLTLMLTSTLRSKWKYESWHESWVPWSTLRYANHLSLLVLCCANWHGGRHAWRLSTLNSCYDIVSHYRLMRGTCDPDLQSLQRCAMLYPFCACFNSVSRKSLIGQRLKQQTRLPDIT